MRTTQRNPNPAAVARSLRELEKLFGKRPPENGSAAGKSGAKPESHANEKPACGDYTAPIKQFNANGFLTACAGDVALLHLALVNLATGHALTTPAVIHMAGRGIALAWLAAGGAL